MHARNLAALTGALALTALTACSHTASYNASHFQYAPTAVANKLPGMGAIEMPKADQEASFTGKPTSFTGGGTTLTLPVGQIVREASVLAFRDLFAGGVQAVEKADAGARYTAVIRPRLRSFSYEYNQLKNAGFAITPTTSVTIDVAVSDAAGHEVWHQTVDLGPVEGSTYFVSGTPGEEISKTAHKAILDTLQRAATEAYGPLERAPASGATVKTGDGESL